MNFSITVDPRFQSRYFDQRYGALISMIVLHSGEGSRGSDLTTLCGRGGRLVSAHYYVCRDGTIYQLLKDDVRAWHAGAPDGGSYLGVSDINGASIGIETEHAAGQDWPQIQLDALAWLCRTLIPRYTIQAVRIIAHRWMAPSRKEDPSNLSDAQLRQFIAALYAVPVASLTLATSPRISRPVFGAILSMYNSPVVAEADACYDAIAAAGVDPAVALGFFAKESTFGKDGAAVANHSWGNRRGADGQFASYPSWTASAADWAQHMQQRYVAQGLTTVDQALPVYSPAFENDTAAYIQAVRTLVARWQTFRLYRVVVDGAVNIRQGAGTSYPTAGILQAGALVLSDELKTGQIISGNPQWAHMAPPNDVGFVSMALLEEVKI